MPTITAAVTFRRPKTTTPSSAGASRSSQPMSAEPKIACCRLGSGVPPTTGLGTPSSVFVAFCTVGVPQTRMMSSAARQTRPIWIDHPGAAIAIADAAARQASTISAVPAASCTSPLASQAANHNPTATGGQTHHQRLPRKNP